MSGKQRNLFELKLRKKHKVLNACNDQVALHHVRMATGMCNEIYSHAVRIVSTLPAKPVSHGYISVGCGLRLNAFV